MNLYELKLLESIDRLRDLLAKNSGRSISLRIASDISVCLQQGRAFFESAERSSLEISPLLIFYGMFAFSKAVILSRALTTLDTLPQSHGLRDVTEHSARLDEAKIRIDEKGTFQKLNDSVRELEGLIIFDNFEESIIRKPTCLSDELSGKTIQLRDILARIQSIQQVYLATYDEEPKVFGCNLFAVEKDDNIITFGISLNKKLSDVEAVKKEVNNLRSKFPFLDNWTIRTANSYGSSSSIEFFNISHSGKDEFCEDWFTDKILKEPYVLIPKSNDIRNSNIYEYVDPIVGVLNKSGAYNTALIKKILGLSVSEMTLYYIGMFALGSLVRYRPNQWVNSIRKIPRSDNIIDDRAMTLIENFIDDSLKVYPRMVANAINQPFD
jgi:hypothetical protein